MTSFWRLAGSDRRRDTRTEVEGDGERWPSCSGYETEINRLLRPSLPQGDNTNDLSCGLWLLIMGSGWDGLEHTHTDVCISVLVRTVFHYLKAGTHILSQHASRLIRPDQLQHRAVGKLI